MAIARQNGKLRGKQPRLKPARDREIRRMHDSGNYNVAEIAAPFSVSRPTVYRSLERTTALPPLPVEAGSAHQGLLPAAAMRAPRRDEGRRSQPDWMAERAPLHEEMA